MEVQQPLRIQAEVWEQWNWGAMTVEVTRHSTREHKIISYSNGTNKCLFYYTLMRQINMVKILKKSKRYDRPTSSTCGIWTLAKACVPSVVRGAVQINIARIAKRCPENITSVVKCVKLLFPKVLSSKKKKRLRDFLPSLLSLLIFTSVLLERAI